MWVYVLIYKPHRVVEIKCRKGFFLSTPLYNYVYFNCINIVKVTRRKSSRIEQRKRHWHYFNVHISHLIFIALLIAQLIPLINILIILSGNLLNVCIWFHIIWSSANICAVVSCCSTRAPIGLTFRLTSTLHWVRHTHWCWQFSCHVWVHSPSSSTFQIN